MTHTDDDRVSQKVIAETVSAFGADFLDDLDVSALAAADGAASGVGRVPTGCAVLVVKRGPNAASRFLLDQPVTSAGRHPGSDIFLDDITVSGASTGPTRRL